MASSWLYAAPPVAPEDRPPERPRVSGIENEGQYFGAVSARIEAAPGTSYTARLSRDGGRPRRYTSGTAILLPGEYRLELKALRRSNDKRRVYFIYFRIRKQVLALLLHEDTEPGPAPSRLARARDGMETLRAGLIDTNYFRVIEPHQVERMRTVVSSGCEETLCAVEIGRGLDAHRVLSARPTRNGRLRINVVDVDTGGVIFSREVPLFTEDAGRDRDRTVREISARLLGVETTLFELPGERAAVLWRSALLPGWGQLHDGQRNKGRALIVAAAGTGTYMTLSYLEFDRARQAYDAFIGIPAALAGSDTFLLNSFLIAERGAALDAAEERFQQSILLFAATYAIGLLDAILLRGDGRLAGNESYTPPAHGVIVDFASTLTGDSTRRAFADPDSRAPRFDHRLRLGYRTRF